MILVLHTFGADLKWNAHLHVIITAGGLSSDKTRWVANRYIPQQCIRPMYRYAFLKELTALFKAGKLPPPPSCRNIKTPETFNSWLTQFHKKEWYVNLGKTLEEASFTIRYVGRYGKRPVLAESKITAFDGQHVTFCYKDRATGEDTSRTLPVQEFIGRLVMHIPDQHFRCLRQAGLFANRRRTKMLAIAQQCLKQSPKPEPRRIPWRDMIIKTYHHDPLACPNCGGIMQRVHTELVQTSDIRQRVSTKQQELELRAKQQRPEQKPLTVTMRGLRMPQLFNHAPPAVCEHFALSMA